MNVWVKRVGWFGLAFGIGWVMNHDDADHIATNVGVVTMGIGLLFAIGQGFGITDKFNWPDKPNHL